MISWRLAVPAVLVAAAFAGCFSYFVPTLPLVTGPLPEKMPKLRTGIPADIDRTRTEEGADKFLQAAQTILKQEPDAQASADKPTVAGHIPLPKKRPIPRQ